MACEAQQSPGPVDATPAVSEGVTHPEGDKDGKAGPFEAYRQEAVAIADGVLYFCDSQNDGALTAYELATAESNVISKEPGGIWNTATGVYYVTKGGVQPIQGRQLGERLVLPENAAFIDVDENGVYYMTEWVSAGATATYGSCKKIYRAAEGAEPELIYEVTTADDCVYEALLLDGKLYPRQKTGVYVTELATEETKQVSEQFAEALRTDGNAVYFQKGSGGKYALYEITQEATAGWLGSTKNHGICMFDGNVYSVEEAGLVVKALTAADGEGETYEGVTHDGATASMACDGEYVAFRREHFYDLHLFHLRTGEYRCIDGNQK